VDPAEVADRAMSNWRNCGKPSCSLCYARAMGYIRLKLERGPVRYSTRSTLMQAVRRVMRRKA